LHASSAPAPRPGSPPIILVFFHAVCLVSQWPAGRRAPSLLVPWKCSESPPPAAPSPGFCPSQMAPSVWITHLGVPPFFAPPPPGFPSVYALARPGSYRGRPSPSCEPPFSAEAGPRAPASCGGAVHGELAPHTPAGPLAFTTRQPRGRPPQLVPAGSRKNLNRRGRAPDRKGTTVPRSLEQGPDAGFVIPPPVAAPRGDFETPSALLNTQAFSAQWPTSHGKRASPG